VRIAGKQSGAAHWGEGDRANQFRKVGDSGALMGIELDAAGRIYVVDAVRDRILRLSPR
jgi:hypothetical protein